MKRRFASLDWARGWMLIASVGVNSILLMPAWFNHATWDGVHPLDIIFPMFVTLSGCGLAFALSRRIEIVTMLRRVVVLVLVGLAYNAVMDWSVDPATWRVTGVLQLYALIVPAVSLLHLVTRSARGWALITLMLAVAHSTLLLLYGASCPSNVLTPSCNPSGPIDSAVFGSAHIYAGGAAGYDPEGIVVMFGALVSAAAGATAGHALRAMAARTEAPLHVFAELRPLIVPTLFFAVLGWVLVYVYPLFFAAQLPVMKRLWTAPFSLFIAAGTTVLLILGYLVMDRRKVTPRGERAALPLIALGRNSLLVYFGSHVLTRIFDQPLVGDASVSSAFLGLVPSQVVAQIIWSLVLIAAWIIIAIFLHRRKIYVKP